MVTKVAYRGTSGVGKLLVSKPQIKVKVMFCKGTSLHRQPPYIRFSSIYKWVIPKSSCACPWASILHSQKHPTNLYHTVVRKKTSFGQKKIADLKWDGPYFSSKFHFWSVLNKKWKVPNPATLLTFHTNFGVAHKSSLVLNGNCKCYIEYKDDRPRYPCGKKIHRRTQKSPHAVEEQPLALPAN